MLLLRRYPGYLLLHWPVWWAKTVGSVKSIQLNLLLKVSCGEGESYLEGGEGGGSHHLARPNGPIGGSCQQLPRSFGYFKELCDSIILLEIMMITCFFWTYCYLLHCRRADSGFQYHTKARRATVLFLLLPWFAVSNLTCSYAT